MPTILSESLEHSIAQGFRKFKIVPILISFFLVLFTILFVRDLAQRSLLMTIDSNLPYPGILRTHALYPLKLLRDNFLVVTTRDPVDRAFLYRHLSDKAMSAAGLSADCGDALYYVSAAQEYRSQMKDSLEEAHKMGMKPEVLHLERSEYAFEKHDEVMQQTARRCGKNKLKNAQRELTSFRLWFVSTYHTP